MNPDQFWSSQDGQILSIHSKDENTVSLTLAFWPRNPVEFAFMRERLGDFKFSERSSLARIGIEMQVQGPPAVDGHRLALETNAFIYDTSFPNAADWKKPPPPGTPGRRAGAGGKCLHLRHQLSQRRVLEETAPARPPRRAPLLPVRGVGKAGVVD